MFKNPTITEILRLDYVALGMYREQKKGIPKKVLYMILETMRLEADQEIDGKMK
jgi:hypothetical protein